MCLMRGLHNSRSAQESKGTRFHYTSNVFSTHKWICRTRIQFLHLLLKLEPPVSIIYQKFTNHPNLEKFVICRTFRIKRSLRVLLITGGYSQRLTPLIVQAQKASHQLGAATTGRGAAPPARIEDRAPQAAAAVFHFILTTTIRV